ncbi:amidohydrolase family protein [Microbacterium caowuchunii]|uniref:Amidohydrolase family protein n=1 Tax=Microbacterium caowuchunii TaxID=2614638 RepID=A0A5N0TIJ3_9MICO|nr:amidohydrolase family protein [Microbacterium caowuchunii]KAA9134421.1 amidohydrolase family protein [Microbacterium caowuchunii]
MTARAVVRFRTRAGAWETGVVDAGADGGLTLREGTDASAPRLGGVVTGGFTDAHVHLSLVPAAELTGGVLGRVIDLGGDPVHLAATADAAERAGLHIDFAGPFLTAPGGYPSDRPWAAAGTFREVAGADAIRAAIADVAGHGASLIKVAGNSTAGPVLGDEDLRTVVTEARRHGLPVVVHAEGPGEAVRAARLGADLLAHAPFTEVLADDDLRAMARGTGWISTLDIHGWGRHDEHYAIATSNIRRFRAVGGRVIYGTDLGNGPLPVGLNARELAALAAAGMSPAEILDALSPLDPLQPHTPLVHIPGDDPRALHLPDARPLTAHHLQEL